MKLRLTAPQTMPHYIRSSPKCALMAGFDIVKDFGIWPHLQTVQWFKHVLGMRGLTISPALIGMIGIFLDLSS
ncbi:MAG: hypothetical protein R3F53_22775 [Gammaproteobacteria bacterium]